MPHQRKHRRKHVLKQLLQAALALLLCAGLVGCGQEAPSGSQAASSLPGGGVSTGAPAAQSTAGSTAPGPDYPAAGVLPKTQDAGLQYAKDTLFLGDSNTERMLYYADVTGVTLENGFGVVSMGIGTFATQGCARFEGVDGLLTMPEVVKLLQPRRVVMTFGTNNVGMRVDGFVALYEEALAAVKRACPETDIIVGGIFPVDQYRQNTSITMKGIDAMNEALAKMCKDEGVYFLNWGEAMLDESIGYSLFESTIQDGVHLSRAGMQAIFEYFRTHSLPEAPGGAAPPKATAKRIATAPGVIRQDGKKQPGPIDWAKVEAQNGPVTVLFSAWDETGGVAGGGSVSPGSVSVKPGGTSGAVTASPAQGYVFMGWVFGSGVFGGSSATTTVTVDAAVPPASTVTVTAVFRRQQPVSPSSSSVVEPSSVLPPPVPSSSAPVPSSSSAPPPPSSEKPPSSSPQEPSSSEPPPTPSSSEPAPSSSSEEPPPASSEEEPVVEDPEAAAPAAE